HDGACERRVRALGDEGSLGVDDHPSPVEREAAGGDHRARNADAARGLDRIDPELRDPGAIGFHRVCAGACVCVLSRHGVVAAGVVAGRIAATSSTGSPNAVVTIISNGRYPGDSTRILCVPPSTTESAPPTGTKRGRSWSNHTRAERAASAGLTRTRTS